MELVEERVHGTIRARVAACDCAPDCATRYVYATTHPVLWVAVASCPDPVTGFLVDAALHNPDVTGAVAQGVALLGLTWPAVLARTLDQLAAIDGLPEWMMRVPVRDVWACRRVVFGDDLVRVPRALEVLEAAYVREGPLR